MSSRFSARAKENRAHTADYHLLKVIPHTNINPFTKVKSASGKETNILSSQALNLHRKRNELVILPTTAIPSTLFEGAGQITFRLNAAPVITHDLILDFTVQNTDGAANQRISAAPMSVDRIEFFSAGGSSPLQTILGDSIWYDTCQYYTKEQITGESTRNNIDPSTYNAVTTNISPGASVNYSFSVIGNFLSQKLFIGTINPIDIRVTFKSATNNVIVNAGTGPIVCTDIRLRIPCEEMPDEEASKMIERFRAQPHTYRIIQTLYQQLQPTFASNQTQTIKLNGMGGLSPELSIMFRASLAAASDAQTTLVEPSTIEILDNAGVSLMNSNSLPVDYIRKSMGIKNYPSGFGGTKSAIYIPFVEEPWRLVVGNCINQGYETFNDNQIRINAGTLNTTYFMDVFLKVYALLTIDTKGNITIQNS